MADHHNPNSHNYTKSPISSFSISPKFRPSTPKDLFGYSENQNPVPDKNTPSWDKSKLDSGPIGLAIVDQIIDDPVHEIEKSPKPRNGEVLFGSKIRVQAPGDDDDHHHMIKNSDEALSLSEMELSEDYTCVISHGPNPKTTHIFDDGVFERCFCVFSESLRSESFMNRDDDDVAMVSFVRFCDTCKKRLGQSNDVIIYRVDKAFCSHECRNQEMVLDGMES